MAKKRKTRAQKERAAQRRVKPAASTKAKPAPKSLQPKADPGPKPEVEPKPPQVSPDKNRQAQHQARLGSMRLSLIALGVLVLVQLLLWGADYTGLISLDILDIN